MNKTDPDQEIRLIARDVDRIVQRILMSFLVAVDEHTIPIAHDMESVFFSELTWRLGPLGWTVEV